MYSFLTLEIVEINPFIFKGLQNKAILRFQTEPFRGPRRGFRQGPLQGAMWRVGSRPR